DSRRLTHAGAGRIRARRAAGLQVLAGGADAVDGAAGLGAALVLDDGADEDDALALLPRDPGPVVRVGGVGQVLVLPHLRAAGLLQMLQPYSPRPGGQQVLDRVFLGPVDDVLHHGAGVEVLEVQDLL